MHNIIEIIVETCEENHHEEGRQSVFHTDREVRGSTYESVHRNTIVIEKQTEENSSIFSFFN